MLCHVELIKKKNKVNSVLTTHPFRNRTLPMFQTFPLCFCLIGAPFLPKGKHYFWENYSFTLPAMMEHYIGGPHNEPWLSLISPVQSPSMLTSGSVSIWVDLADGTVISMIVRQGINNSGGYMKNNWEKIVTKNKCRNLLSTTRF